MAEGITSVYLAAPLFNDAERVFNLSLCDQLSPHVRVYLPQRDGGIVAQMIEDGTSVRSAYRRVFDRDIAGIKASDAILVVLDGRTIDEGAAFELGFAFALGKRCFGLQTDSRRLSLWGNNPMVEVPLELIFRSVEQCREWFIHREEKSMSQQVGE